MDKNEFLNQLKLALGGEVSSEVVEQNIRYYDQYINSSTKEEEASIIRELGNPRLIAKTIIETQKIVREKNRFHNTGTDYSDFQGTEDINQENGRKGNESPYSFGGLFQKFTWKHKLIAVLSVIALFAVIVIVGRLVVGILFAFGPLIIVLLVIFYLFRRR